jgi:hypothetical protein
MADPIVVPVSLLPELMDLATGDLITAVDISEAVSANKTKKLQAGNIKIFSTAQLADSIVTVAKLANDAVESAKIKDLNVTTGKLADKAVTAAKIADTTITGGKLVNGTITATQIANNTITATQIADNAVTESKLGTIKRTVMFRITGPLDEVEVLNFGNFVSWPVSLNGFVVVDARINLATAGTSTTTVVLSNQGGVMSTLSLASGATGMSATGTIASSYRTASTNSFLAVNVSAAGTNAAGLTITLVLEGNPA